MNRLWLSMMLLLVCISPLSFVVAQDETEENPEEVTEEYTDTPVDEEFSEEEFSEEYVEDAYIEDDNGFANPLVERLEELGAYPCPGEVLTCVSLELPLNHDDPEGEQIEVVFGVRPADYESQGMLVVAVGGPGASGIASGNYYVDYGRFGDATYNMDIVFFDQRGVGLSYPLNCPAAYDNYLDVSLFDDPETAQGERQMIDSARTFALDCQEEMDDPEVLPYLSTRYAVDDLEMFLENIGQKKIYMYGESYGTQFAQTYAMTYPERMAGLILDGAVDLSLSGPDFYRTYVKVLYDRVLMMLEDCNEDKNCASDMGGDAIKLFHEVAEKVKVEPAQVRFPLPTGGFEIRSFGYREFRIAFEQVDEITLRALAATRFGNYIPLMRIYYLNSLTNPVTHQPEVIADYYDYAPFVTPTEPSLVDFSDGAYYNVDCSDYQFFAGTPEERAQAFLGIGDELEQQYPIFSRRFYADLPCVFWSTSGPQERPKPFTGGRYPTFVINGTADTATPVDNGFQIFQHLQNGYMITKRAGGHVNFALDDGIADCADNLLLDFIYYKTLPAQREFVCPGKLLEGYLPLNEVLLERYTSPLDILEAVAEEIEALPEFNQYDSSYILGCPYGGLMSIAGADYKYLTFADCTFISGFTMTGTGYSSPGYEDMLLRNSMTLSISVSGDAEGRLNYFRDADNGLITVDGEYNGQVLRPVP
jgi:pimeloyl-ACP methyl ester carboxylesterase